MEKVIYIIVNYEYGYFKDYEEDYALEEWDSSATTTSAYTTIEAAYHKARYLAKQEASCCSRPYELVCTTPEAVGDGEDMPEVAIHFTDDDTCSLWAVVEMHLDIKPSVAEQEFEELFPDKKTVKDFDYCCNCKKWAGSIGGESGYCRYRDKRMTDGLVVMNCIEFEKKE